MDEARKAIDTAKGMLFAEEVIGDDERADVLRTLIALAEVGIAAHEEARDEG